MLTEYIVRCWTSTKRGCHSYHALTGVVMVTTGTVVLVVRLGSVGSGGREGVRVTTGDAGEDSY